MDTIGARIRGVYRDVLLGSDRQLRHDSGWIANTIVERCRILLAGFLKNDIPSGIQFFAVGQGVPEWDTDNQMSPVDSASTDLVNRHSPPIPVEDLNLVYLDDSDAVVEGPTNRLQITATLEAGYPEIPASAVSFPLREFGLFGTFNGDYLINYVRHPVIHKDASATLIRVIRLYL